MKTKPSMFKLSFEAREALEAEAKRTGKTLTSVIEDLLLFRRIFADDGRRILVDHAPDLTKRTAGPEVWRNPGASSSLRMG